MIKNSRNHRGTKAFTLVEMLVVIGIIVLLSGLTIAGFGFMNQKQAREQAKVQIAMLSSALEQYYADNGEWPEGNRSNGDRSSNNIFQALFPPEEEEGATIYLAELDPDNDRQGWLGGQTNRDQVEILDPWGYQYRYRTGSRAGNPDFDLWSVGPDGRTRALSRGRYDKKHEDNLDDVRGW